MGGGGRKGRWEKGRKVDRGGGRRGLSGDGKEGEKEERGKGQCFGSVLIDSGSDPALRLNIPIWIRMRIRIQSRSRVLMIKT